MRDHRFGQSAIPLERAPQHQVAVPALTPRDRYLRDWKIVKRARFNAAKRYERKQNASIIAFALAGIVGFLVPIYTLLFKDALLPHTKNVLDFTAFVTGALSLMLGLIEQAKDYPAKARHFDMCGRAVNSVLRRLTIAHITEDKDLRPFLDDYEEALEKCGDNHDDIDWCIARAEQERETAEARERNRQADQNALAKVRKEVADAKRKLTKLKWQERAHIYWLYAAMWFVPPATGFILWFFAAQN
jgi:SMODS and SLOG-associating 2TM effector domain family 5